MVILTVLVAICVFALSIIGFVGWVLSGLVTVGAVMLFFSHQTAGGIAFLVIAFLVSPYGLPALTAWLISKMDEAKFSLRDFIVS